MTTTQHGAQGGIALDAQTWRVVAVTAAAAAVCWITATLIEAITIDGLHGVGDRILIAFEQTTPLLALLAIAIVLCARVAGDALRDRALAFATLAAALISLLLCIGAVYAAWRAITIHVDTGNINQAVALSFGNEHATFWERTSGALSAAASFVLASLAFALAWPTVRGSLHND